MAKEIKESSETGKTTASESPGKQWVGKEALKRCSYGGTAVTGPPAPYPVPWGAIAMTEQKKRSGKEKIVSLWSRARHASQTPPAPQKVSTGVVATSCFRDSWEGREGTGRGGRMGRGTDKGSGGILT